MDQYQQTPSVMQGKKALLKKGRLSKTFGHVEARKCADTGRYVISYITYKSKLRAIFDLRSRSIVAAQTSGIVIYGEAKLFVEKENKPPATDQTHPSRPK